MKDMMWNWDDLLPRPLRHVSWTNHFIEQVSPNDQCWSDPTENALNSAISSSFESLQLRNTQRQNLGFGLAVADISGHRASCHFNEPARRTAAQLLYSMNDRPKPKLESLATSEVSWPREYGRGR